MYKDVQDHKRNANAFEANALLKTLDHVRRQDVQEQHARTMIKVPSFNQLKGHDCYPEALKAVIILWENSGRGKFEQMQNIL